MSSRKHHNALRGARRSPLQRDTVPPPTHHPLDTQRKGEREVKRAPAKLKRKRRRVTLRNHSYLLTLITSRRQSALHQHWTQTSQRVQRRRETSREKPTTKDGRAKTESRPAPTIPAPRQKTRGWPRRLLPRRQPRRPPRPIPAAAPASTSPLTSARCPWRRLPRRLPQCRARQTKSLKRQEVIPCSHPEIRQRVTSCKLTPNKR